MPDGSLEFLGRVDNQVKIRGFRVELGEIETVLAGHPFVKEAVLSASTNSSGEQRLIAYIVEADGCIPSEAELRDFLTASLPNYMMPAVFVTLDALPLTPSGKIDRQNLPAAPSHSQRGERRMAPSNSLEETLMGIWSELLGLDEVGTDDSFFELGGHSLLAMQMLTRVADALDVDVPLTIIFDKPTVARLATWIQENRVHAKAEGAIQITVVPRSRVRVKIRQKEIAPTLIWPASWPSFPDFILPEQTAFQRGGLRQQRSSVEN